MELWSMEWFLTLTCLILTYGQNLKDNEWCALEQNRISWTFYLSKGKLTLPLFSICLQKKKKKKKNLLKDSCISLLFCRGSKIHRQTGWFRRILFLLLLEFSYIKILLLWRKKHIWKQSYPSKYCSEK